MRVHTSDLAFKLDCCAAYFEHWLAYQDRERSRDGLETTDDTAIITPPEWPTRGNLQAIVGALREAQEALTKAEG